jgi:ribonucleoside-diphosphate reductase alpha chain
MVATHSKEKTYLNGKNDKAHVTRPIELMPNARTVLEKRYLRRGADGKPVETVEGMFWRIAYNIALAEQDFGTDVEALAERYYDLLTQLRFLPNSPTFTGAGTPLGQLAACFVLPLDDDMGREHAGIFQTLRNAALIQQTGGGNGFSFSRLRPKNALVISSAGRATGPVGFLRVYDKAFGEIAQGGTRRGANMGVLRVDHPDIEDFITCKTDENAITNFNISVGITDAFMRAVEADTDWDLVFPDVEDPRYKTFRGTIEQAQAAGIPLKVHKTLRARDLWAKIIAQAHFNGEPGCLFLDASNRTNPVPHLYALEATNPCGEQWLGPYENCCLGSVNLAKHFGADHSLDWEKLRETVVLSTRFLDGVVTSNAYVPAVPELKVAALAARRIGLGIMGLGDLMYHMGVRYGSVEGQELAAQVMEFVRYHTMLTSMEMARENGAFGAVAGSIYEPGKVSWQVPNPIMPYKNDFGRPAINWQNLWQEINRYGVRNAAQTTVAPTGTIATVAGCEAYGCEPNFALAYIRHVNDNGKDLKLTYTSPLFEQALITAGLDEATRTRIVEQVLEHGSCQDIAELPSAIRNTFVVSADITADEHVKMQAAIQAFVDNSISKTCNFPEGATVDDVAAAYLQAWKLGCKGLTVYVTGSRQKVVLETHATAKAKEAVTAPTVAVEPVPQAIQPPLIPEGKKPRPRALQGFTYQVQTPLGKSYLTINQGADGEPFELFISTTKAGTETFAVSEAIGRLVSYILRLSSTVPPRERLNEVARQLEGIGGGRSMGFGPNRVRSLPDALGRALYDFLSDTEGATEPLEVRANFGYANGTQPAPGQMKFELHGDLCPECGHASVIQEEGCAKCYSCGHSEC